MEDFVKYRQMQARGATSSTVYKAAKIDGLDEITAIRMLRSIFGLSLLEAKQAISLAEGRGKGLSEQQAELKDAIDASLKQNDDV
ncbi:MAG: hypothetical protein ACLPX9_06565 [Rhodomicrobium sp.]